MPLHKGQPTHSGPQVAQNGLHTPPQDSSPQAPPPVYTEAPQRGPSTPPPDITAAFSNLSLNASDFPKPDHCLAHLKLLEAFNQLRDDISSQDGLFGLYDSFATSKEEAENNNQLNAIREKRWIVYVAKAVQRFEAWWTNCVQRDASKLRISDMPSVLRRIDDKWTTLVIRELPPLDVIMVWHAYQLNPRDFLEDCVRYGKFQSWMAGLPWEQINKAIDNDSFEYEQPQAIQTMWKFNTGFEWNSLSDSPDARITCPQCTQSIRLPWTTCNDASMFQRNRVLSKELNCETSGAGFADKTMLARCVNCGMVVRHSDLTLAKFRADWESLDKNGNPLPGTILDQHGRPTAPPASQHHAPLFPNDLLLRNKFYCNMYNDTTPGKGYTMETVRTAIESLLKNPVCVRAARPNSRTRRMIPMDRIAIRRMMSHYWDNSSPFALDLVGAVIRQGVFVQKMHDIDWIHSPAARNTVSRCIVKYERFMNIISWHPDKVAVPTLDVDLAWHTHQLNPRAYYTFTTKLTDKFIDHDDKIEETKLSDSFEWTSKIYQKEYKELYSECTCWYCEAIRESHTNNLTAPFSSTAKEISSQLDNLHSSTDPANKSNAPNPVGNHISAHNAIRATTLRHRAVQDRTLQHKLEREYKRSLKKAQKAGRSPPSRGDNHYYAYAGGAYGFYPVPVPFYAPYQCDPSMHPGMYPGGSPSCANFTPGAAGNCVSGACGGGCGGGGGG